VIGRLTTRHLESSIGFGEAGLRRPDRVHNAVSVVIGLTGTAVYEELVAALTELDGVLAVSATNPDDETDPEFE
jgi:hypothetical protein